MNTLHQLSGNMSGVQTSEAALSSTAATTLVLTPSATHHHVSHPLDAFKHWLDKFLRVARHGAGALRHGRRSQRLPSIFEAVETRQSHAFTTSHIYFSFLAIRISGRAKTKCETLNRSTTTSPHWTITLAVSRAAKSPLSTARTRNYLSLSVERWNSSAADALKNYYFA